MTMWLNDEGLEILSDLIDKRLRELLDWTDFIEDSGVPTYILDRYLNREKYDVEEETLAGLAVGLGMSYVGLYCDLKWEVPDDALEAARQAGSTEQKVESKMSVSVAEEYESRANKALVDSRRSEFGEPYNKLWDIFDESTDAEERKRLAPKIADLSYRSGMLYYDENDFLGLCGAYNAAYQFVTENPEFSEGALTCVMLAVGVFEKKFSFHEFENVESYIDELVPVTKMFPNNENFVLHSTICLCNLLQLCPYDYGVFFVRIIEVLNQIIELAELYHENIELQLCYLRSLVFFLCYGKPRLKDEIYEKYFDITKNAFAVNKGIVPEWGFSEMRYALRENEIFID